MQSDLLSLLKSYQMVKLSDKKRHKNEKLTFVIKALFASITLKSITINVVAKSSNPISFEKNIWINPIWGGGV